MTKKTGLEAEKTVLEIMALLSHELQNGFISNIGILNRIQKSKGKDQEKEIARVIKKLKHLQLMTSGVLTREVILSSTNTPFLELLDFRETLDGALEYYIDDFNDYKKVVDRSMGYIPRGVVIVKSNRAVLELATHTILNNQVKYGGPILAYGYREDEIYFYIIFFNNGLPIPAWLKEKLFKSNGREFHDSPGTGYGLLGAQRLLKKIGCLLSYEESDGHPLFIIRIPKEI